ncbi:MULTISPECIES: ATP-binding protein [unclassified Geobacillus]|uniref:ATP-binding protein n=1 Tax=unclassified Geobacillus TaxID=2642459 RepID=UPI000C28A9AB|nr:MULTISPECIES: ATP-binding protein [unclassified Geobacillus]PJW13375.1 PAS domain-containing sensor histidine kinase [Geobacillus sp. Manikaran-105]PJW16464.1 PAS domain-containing sensor histidine kinase [Geobacillus sp. WSUCF-018B]
MFNKSKVMASYIAFSLLWLVVTDALINMLPVGRGLYMALGIAKGAVFILLSVVFLYQLLTKREQLEKAEENEQQLLTLINSMPDFVCFKDSEGRWLRVNDFGRRLYHLEHIDYVGKTDRELGELVPFFKDTFEQCIESDREAWKSGTLTRREESFETLDGERKTFDVIKVPLFEENGARKGLLTIGRDITQQKRAEELLLKKEKLSVLGELAAGIAHEIRNPLTSMKGFIQMMQETREVNDDYMRIMLSELGRINQIVSELLVLAKPQSHNYRPFLLSEAVSYVISLIGHEATLNNVLISVHNNAPKACVYGDQNQIVQVLLNVMKNAIEAMPGGGSLYVRVSEAGGTVYLDIADTGIGISKERLQKIGEPFFTLKEKGMGLGLTTSMKIIQEHKGTMQIESEVGKGTIVHLTLPSSYAADAASG